MAIWRAKCINSSVTLLKVSLQATDIVAGPYAYQAAKGIGNLERMIKHAADKSLRYAEVLPKSDKLGCIPL